MLGLNSFETTDAFMPSSTDQINLLCAQSLFKNASASNLATIASSLVINFYFLNVDISLHLWTLFMCTISLVRMLQAHSFKRTPQENLLADRVNRWLNGYVLSSFLVGCGWASLTLLVPRTLDAMHLSMLYLILFAVMTASIIALLALFRAFFVYNLPIYIAAVSFSVAISNTHAAFLAAAITIYFLFITMAGRTLNRHYRHNLELLIENESLISSLHSEIEQKEAFEQRLIQNQQALEETVEHRTQELSEVNRALVNEINERRRIEANLKHMAHHDSLTNLPNRLLLDARLSHAIARARRDKTRIAVIFIDLDHFKTINDSLGHDIGDRLLIEIGQRLQSCIREEDTLARLGGDEFIMVIEQLHETTQLDSLLEKIMQKTSKTIYIDEHKLSTSASIGISIYPDDGNNTEQLMRNADAAMYYVKEHGRHKYHFYTRAMSASGYDRLALEADLKQAVDNNQILVYYQPQIGLQSGKITGVEALVRWRHPELGVLPPAQFLNIAEQCGMMIKIGETVLTLACRQMTRWKQQGLPLETVAVNIAGSQIHNGDLLEVVSRALETTGCKSDWLELEITEDFIIKETQRSIETLQQLRDLGLSLAIDDFGTGYSSLSYLKQLPVNKLKIDRSFIRDISTDMEDAALVNAIISMGKSLKLKLIAEGVENGSHEIFLSAHNCEYAQGFYYSPPLPADELVAFLHQHSH